MRQKMIEAHKNVCNLTESSSGAEKENSRIKEEVAQLQKKVMDQQRECREHMAKLERLAGENKTMNDEITSSRNNREETEGELRKSRREVEEVQGLLSAAERKYEELLKLNEREKGEYSSVENLNETLKEENLQLRVDLGREKEEKAGLSLKVCDVVQCLNNSVSSKLFSLEVQ